MREMENVMSFATGKPPYSPPLIIENTLGNTLGNTLAIEPAGR
jgi:hypothetical protein